jgi:hypothetical protein
MNDKPVIEIIIRSNLPNVGKTFIAARLTGVIKDEFGGAVFVEQGEKDDLQNAIYMLNEHGTPRLEDLTVLIRDEDGKVDQATLDKLTAEVPIAPKLERFPGENLIGEVVPTETPHSGASA